MSEFARFYREHYRLVVTIAEHRLSSFHDAEEIASEAFRVALRRHQDGGELTMPWLYGVVRNLIGNEYRRRSRTAALYERLESDWATEDTGAPADVSAVREALELLTEPQQDILKMLYWDELTMTEAASILGCGVGAMRVRALRARRALAKALEVITAAENASVR